MDFRDDARVVGEGEGAGESKSSALRMALALKAELNLKRAPLLSGGGTMGDEMFGREDEGKAAGVGPESEDGSPRGKLRMITRHEVEKLEREMLRSFEAELQSLKQRLDANRSTQAAALKHFIECRKVLTSANVFSSPRTSGADEAARPGLRPLPADKAALLTLKHLDQDAAQLLLSHLHRKAVSQARQIEQMSIKLKKEEAGMGDLQLRLHALEHNADVPVLKEKLSSAEAEVLRLQGDLSEAQTKVSELSSLMNGREVDVRKAVDRERAAGDEARGLRKELERALLDVNVSRRQSEYDKADVKRLQEQLDEKLNLIGRFEAEIEDMKDKVRAADSEAERRFVAEKATLHELLEKERRKVADLGAQRQGPGAGSRAEGGGASPSIGEEDGIADNSALRRKLAMVEAALADSNTRRNVAIYERDQAQKDLATLQEKYNSAVKQINEQKGRRRQ